MLDLEEEGQNGKSFSDQKSSLIQNLEEATQNKKERDSRRGGNYRGRKKKGKRREREIYVFEKKDKGNRDK